MLEIQNVSKTFNAGTVNQKTALNGLNLKLNEGDFVTVIGGNGAGKSTTFNMICGYYPPTEGKIFYNGEDITNKKAYEDTNMKIARTFQIMKPLKNLSVLDNVTAAAYFGHAGAKSEKEAKERAMEVLHFTGLYEKRRKALGNKRNDIPQDAIAEICRLYGDFAESPLSKMTDWVNTTCPCCGGPAKRETDTMPQWAGSSWYFLRYMDPHNDKALASKEALDYWSPVDWYNGGMEHTTLHLLYSRFWHKFLYDIGVVPTKEPYAKRTSHGMILGEGGEKMSKSRGNVVNPNDIVAQYGADTMRLHIMFIGDFEKAVSWSNEAVKGSKRFLDRCFNLQDIATDEESISAKNESIVHKTIKKVSQDIDELKMNTAIAAMMTMVNEFYANGCSKGDVEMLCLLLSPFAPHMVEEMWENMGFAAKYGKMAMQMDWPEHDEAKTVDSHVEMAVQVNGKLKGTVTVPVDSDEAAVVAAAMESDKVKKATEGMSVVKTILVRNKLVNLIVKPAK